MMEEGDGVCVVCACGTHNSPITARPHHQLLFLFKKKEKQTHSRINDVLGSKRVHIHVPLSASLSLTDMESCG